MRYSRARNIPSWLWRNIKMLVVPQMSCYFSDTLWCHVFCIDVLAANSTYLWPEIECARVSTHYLLNWCLCFFLSFQKRNPEVRHVDLEILWCHTLHVMSHGHSVLCLKHWKWAEQELPRSSESISRAKVEVMLLSQNDQRSFTIHTTVTRAVLLSLHYNTNSMWALFSSDFITAVVFRR